MTTEEAQQAQAIADQQSGTLTGIFARKVLEKGRENMKLRELVDSQAQKIADLNRVGSNTLMALIESQEKIAEQAKRIAELEKDAAEHVCCLANNGW